MNNLATSFTLVPDK